MLTIIFDNVAPETATDMQWKGRLNFEIQMVKEGFRDKKTNGFSNYEIMRNATGWARRMTVKHSTVS